MQISETESLLLRKDRESICGATLEILELVNDPKNSLAIKKKMSIILSLLSGMLNYLDLKNNKKSDLTPLAKFSNLIFKIMSNYVQNADTVTEFIPNYWNRVIVRRVEEFCNTVNTITFDLNHKEGIIIVFPKINLNFGHNINQ
jgi:hypothetical protein